MRILFIVKERQEYYGHQHGYIGGLFISTKFVVDMLNANGVTAKLVQVVDNNDIDREVTRFRPDIVAIEALWVVPSKFPVLIKLHPKVHWVVIVHSEIPFLALDGVAVEWIKQYVLFPEVSVAANSERATNDIRAIIRSTYGDFVANTKVDYLPNYYPVIVRQPVNHKSLDIACFGAIRPLKNQLIQGLAAIEYADAKGRAMNFHINGSRVEQNGDNVLRNLRALFAGTPHTLVEHPWENHDQFLATMATMDVSMAVSFSETFNIVSADAVTTQIPIVVSAEVSWASPLCYANPNDTADMVAKLNRVTSAPFSWITRTTNLRRLRAYDAASTKTWLRFISNG